MYNRTSLEVCKAVNESSLPFLLHRNFFEILSYVIKTPCEEKISEYKSEFHSKSKSKIKKETY